MNETNYVLRSVWSETDLFNLRYIVDEYFSAVRTMSDAGEKFTSLQELLKSAIFHRQQLKYEQTRRYVISIPFISLISLDVFVYVVTLKSSAVFDIILAAVLVWYIPWWWER